jgi:hypothetical protein
MSERKKTAFCQMEMSVNTWDDLSRVAEELRRMERAQWVFRGHSDLTWQLRTSLERMARRYR